MNRKEGEIYGAHGHEEIVPLTAVNSDHKKGAASGAILPFNLTSHVPYNPKAIPNQI